MSAPTRLYQQIEDQIARFADPKARITSVSRLASLVVGILASEQCALRRVARELGAMGLRHAQEASTGRRPRRTLADARLDDGAGYGAAVQAVVEWPSSEPLVVLTGLAPCWSVLRRYARRFWIEVAFRQDKSQGWDWEHGQVREPAHQERLLLALAWASLLVLSLGAEQAAGAVAAPRARSGSLPKPTHPRDSLFRLGLGQFRAWLYGTARGRLPWHLPHLTHPSWCAEWLALQQPQPLAQTVLRRTRLLSADRNRSGRRDGLAGLCRRLRALRRSRHAGALPDPAPATDPSLGNPGISGHADDE